MQRVGGRALGRTTLCSPWPSQTKSCEGTRTPVMLFSIPSQAEGQPFSVPRRRIVLPSESKSILLVTSTRLQSCDQRLKTKSSDVSTSSAISRPISKTMRGTFHASSIAVFRDECDDSWLLHVEI